MDDILTTIISFITDSVQSFIAEYTIIFLLIGLALTAFGIFIICYQLTILMMGEKVDGTIIGAVRDVKVKIKDGKVTKKRLNSGTLFPVFEYTLADGSEHQDKGSAGGTHVYKYKTGQKIKLVVVTRENYNDVSELKSYAEYVIGAFLISLGAYIIYIYITHFAALSFSTFIWLGAIISLGLKFKDKLIKFLKEFKSNKENYSQASILKRSFDPDFVKPIEEFVEERQKNRQKHQS